MADLDTPIVASGGDDTGRSVAGKLERLEPRYRAFLSYSHRDRAWAGWLHRTLETYKVPSKLVGEVTGVGAVPRRLTPIFRDREELSASADLGTEIESALADSRFLIVICSPDAAASRWVDQEILMFKQRHAEARVLALIVGGEPYASLHGRPEQECFPRSLRLRLGSDGALSDVPAEPLAADVRRGGDGKRLARLKLAAGLTGLRLDDLVQRETQRRVRRLAFITVAALAGMLLAIGLALYANAQRMEAIEQREIAERESATARAASDYLIGTLVLANPATENPRTVTLLSVLRNSAKRVSTELAGQPAIQARLINTLGRAYNNLGLFDETLNVVARTGPAIARAGEEGLAAQLSVAFAQMKLGRMTDALGSLDAVERQLGPDPNRRPDLRATASVTRGQILASQGKPREALAAYDRAIAFIRADPDPDQRRMVDALQNRALLLSDDGKFAEAEKSLGQALAINRRFRGDRHLTTGQIWFALSQNAFLAGDLKLAEQRISSALAVERRVLDPDNAILADALSMQGQIYQGQNRLAEAQRSLDEAVAIYEKAFRGPHYLIGIAQVYLALVESGRGRTTAALATLDQAKHNYDVGYGEVHANHGDLLVNRAMILATAGRLGEARTDCADGLTILGQTLGPTANYTKAMADICANLPASAGP